MTTPPMNGVLFGPLVESHPDRIVVASRTLYLRDGEACRYEICSALEVIYTEHANGRCDVEKIKLLHLR